MPVEYGHQLRGGFPPVHILAPRTLEQQVFYYRWQHLYRSNGAVHVHAKGGIPHFQHAFEREGSGPISIVSDSKAAKLS